MIRLTDGQWAKLEPLLPVLPHGGRGRPWQANRPVLEAVLWVLRTGAHWRQLPEGYPNCKTCHRRFQQWQRAGVMERIEQALTQELEAKGAITTSECYLDASFVPAKKGARA